MDANRVPPATTAPFKATKKPPGPPKDPPKRSFLRVGQGVGGGGQNMATKYQPPRNRYIPLGKAPACLGGSHRIANRFVVFDEQNNAEMLQAY
eukprot:296116-Prorocentrum_minimum.AAC.1